MGSELKTTINALTARELRTVVSQFPEVAKEGLKPRYAGDADSWSGLQRLAEADARAALASVLPGLKLADAAPDEEALRALLLALSEEPEYEPYLRAALGRRALAALDPVILGSLLVFVLSIRWKVKIRKKNGKTEFEFEASKRATPVAFLKQLIARIPGVGSATRD